MRMKWVIVASAVMLGGCATVSSINKRFQHVVYDDGINRDEAMAIAQHHLGSQTVAKHYMIGTPDVEQIENVWDVTFLFEPTLPGSKYFQTFYRVKIDVSSGKILESGVHKGAGFGWGFRLHDQNM